jgi:hypothetical protein
MFGTEVSEKNETRILCPANFFKVLLFSSTKTVTLSVHCVASDVLLRMTEAPDILWHSVINVLSHYGVVPIMATPCPAA